jgi:hypothetical protein
VVFRPDAHQSATSIQTTRSFRPDAHQCLEASNSSRLHPSRRNGKSSGRSSQCSSASVRTTCQYRPDAIQCLTSFRVSDSRHSYGKTAATVRTMCDPVRTMCDPVRTMSFIRQERAYKVQPSGRQPSGSGRSKPYYGNYVQPKCNCPEARATPSRRVLVMEAFIAILERRLQLTVRTLGQAVRTPSSILDISFYSNIGLGRNRRCWKAKKKFSKLSFRTALQKIPELLSGQEKLGPSGRPWLPSERACLRIPF